MDLVLRYNHISLQMLQVTPLVNKYINLPLQIKIQINSTFKIKHYFFKEEDKGGSIIEKKQTNLLQLLSAL